MRALLFVLLAPMGIPAAEPEVPAVEVPPCCAATSRAAIVETALLADPAAWSLADPAAWKWSGEGEDKVLSLIAQSHFTPKVRSPRNLAWFGPREWKDFTLTAQLRLTAFNAGNNDLCIAFGREAHDRFYYAHLGEKADDAHHQIHLVDRADRRPITTFRTAGAPWKEGAWHQVKVVRNATTGDIGVWFDDMTRPVLVARDTTLTWGRVGLGSFDDLGEFRQVRIRGTSRAVDSPVAATPKP